MLGEETSFKLTETSLLHTPVIMSIEPSASTTLPRRNSSRSSNSSGALWRHDQADRIDAYGQKAV